ncbi:MAG TPA: carboxyl transferase domain-containing protein [Solirubrobacteraceae bacterium]|nr:carboxyl transferase domain-containing protein [Solirubrobacteraceae bacterium]
MLARVAELQRRREHAEAMGGAERIARHHESGRLTARERIDLLVDPGSFRELGLLALPERRPESADEGGAAGHSPATRAPRRSPYGGADGIITGWARIGGRRAAVIAVDATVLGGTTAYVNAEKLMRTCRRASEAGLPVVVLADADGGRMPDVMGWRMGGLPLEFGTLLATPPGRPTILRLCAALGPCFGDAGLEATAAHIAVMTPGASIALSGTEVVETSIGERLSNVELGGPDVAAAVSGQVEMVAETEPEAIALLRRALSYLPDHAGQPAPRADPLAPAADPETLLEVVPVDRRRGYDVRKVLDAVLDAGSLLEYGARKGRSLICGLARIEGEPIGVAASQPMQRGGVLDVPALEKLLAFVRLCDTFNLPIVTLHDVPGLMIGAEAERRGLLRMLETITVAQAHAGVPKISVVMRKSYGGGYFVMNGRQTTPDLLVAWPTAELGFMAPEAGVRTVHRRELEQAFADGGEQARDALLEQLIEEWAHQSEPWEAAAHLYLDDVIDPRDTRRTIAAGIAYCWSQSRVSPTGTR